MISASQFSENVSLIKSKINETAKQSSRSADEIHIVSIAKTFPVIAWQRCLEEGLLLIGESRVQETENKINEFKNRNKIELHLIGHLQKNKTKKAINNFDIIQTIDSISLLDKINNTAKQLNKTQQIFLQINIGKDPQKFGFTEQALLKAAEYQKKLTYVELAGIMTIPPANQPRKSTQKLYSKTRDLKNKIKTEIDEKCKYISMGMSNDYDLAIIEGATHIRLGSALFGKRQNV